MLKSAASESYYLATEIIVVDSDPTEQTAGRDDTHSSNKDMLFTVKAKWKRFFFLIKRHTKNKRKQEERERDF